MKIYTHTHYNVNLPDGWTVENKTDYTIFYLPDGIGDLIISSFEREQEVTEDDLEEFAADHIDSDVDSEEVEYGEFTGFSFCYDVDEEYLCEWFLKSGNLMLFITYSCALEDEDNSEEDIVESILNSLHTQKH